MGRPPDTGEYYNPGVKMYLETHRWTDRGWEPIFDTSPLRFAPEYLPTDTAIELLASHGPLLDVGAGNGYWAEIINRAGGDVLPIDIVTDNRDYYWCDVKKASHTSVTDYPNRDVLLCHPPGFVWVTDLLHLMNESQSLIYIGEWGLSQDATVEFFDVLRELFTLEETFDVLNWRSTNAKGYVFEPSGSRARVTHGMNMMSGCLLENNPYGKRGEKHHLIESIYDRKYAPYGATEEEL